VGKVLKAQGLRGMVKVLPLTDFEERFSPGSSLWVGLPDAGYRLMTVAEATDEGRTILVRFQEVSFSPVSRGNTGFLLSCGRKRIESSSFQPFLLF